MNQKVIIGAYNPYESKFPSRKVISRDELHLIKTLREHGIDYEIKSEHKGKLYILSQKNFESLLTDPIFLTLYSITIGVIVGFINDVLKPNDNLKERLLIKNKDGETFDYEGNKIDKEVIEFVTDKMLSKQNYFSQTISRESPFKDLSIPVHLEHTPEIVGWCNLNIKKEGLFVNPMKVTCSNTWGRIKNQELKGFSIGGLIYGSKCSICESDYVECNHQTSNIYDGQQCICQITGFDLAEISIVKDPANSLATINIARG